MTADTTTLAPCPFCGAQAHFEVDDDRWEWVECERCGMQGNRSASLMESCKLKLAEAWNRRAPAPASGETEICKCCGEGSARIVVHRECDTCTSVYAGVAERRIQKSLAAPLAQEERVPLTEKQISKLWSDAHNDTSDLMAHQVLVRLVETAHGIKGKEVGNAE